MKNAVKSGIYVGVFGIIINLIVYVIDPTLFIKWWFGIGLLVINLGLVIYFGLQYRKEEEGYLTFKEGFLHGFVLLLISGFIGILFSALLYNVIDPELPEILTDATIEQTRTMLENFGTPSDAMDEALEKVREDSPNSYTFGGLLKGYGILIIFYLIISLITGAIVKKSEPDFE